MKLKNKIILLNKLIKISMNNNYNKIIVILK